MQVCILGCTPAGPSVVSYFGYTLQKLPGPEIQCIQSDFAARNDGFQRSFTISPIVFFMMLGRAQCFGLNQMDSSHILFWLQPTG